MKLTIVFILRSFPRFIPQKTLNRVYKESHTFVLTHLVSLLLGIKTLLGNLIAKPSRRFFSVKKMLWVGLCLFCSASLKKPRLALAILRFFKGVGQKKQFLTKPALLLQKAISRSFLFAFLTINVTITPLYAAAETNSAQQALQQLRLLQQRLTKTNNQPNAAPERPNQVEPAQVAPVNNPQQAQAQVSANQILTETENELVDVKAFEGVTQQLFPLSPEQIIRLKQLYHANEFAEASPAGTPPKPTATSQFVNLSPGSTPPVIRLSQGFVSSLVFLDSTGAPWPISAYDLGDPSSFNIQWDKTSNTLMIQSLKLYNYGNLAVRLRGLNTPVMLTLIPGQKAVDYRVDLRIQGYGPNAKSMPMEEGIPPSTNDVLLHVLDGVPPAGSQRLTVSGGDARAWLRNDRMYVRTNLTILSPGWLGSMTSADGMHAYEMQKSPVLLVSWHGKVMQLKVEGL